jgi:hypothetical protein
MRSVSRFLIFISGLALLSQTYATESRPWDWGWGAHPIIGYDDQTGWTLGASNVFYYDPDSSRKDHEVDELDLTTTYSPRGAYNVATDITKNFKGNSQALEVAMGYEKSIQNYYGVGKDASDSLIATYSSIDVPLNLSYSFPIYKNLHASPVYDFHYQNFENIEYKITEVEDSEFEDKATYSSGVGLDLNYRTTNPGLYKKSGYSVEVSGTYYTPKLWSSTEFALASLSYRHYFPFFSECVLGFQFRYEKAWGDVPIFYLPAVGGHKLLRGFDNEKYKANNSYAGQTEFRFPIWWRIGGTAFVGAGEAADHTHEFGENIRVAGGLGLRLMVQKKQRINIRFDFTYNSDGEIMKYIKLMEAF